MVHVHVILILVIALQNVPRMLVAHVGKFAKMVNVLLSAMRILLARWVIFAKMVSVPLVAVMIKIVLPIGVVSMANAKIHVHVLINFLVVKMQSAESQTI